jgi:putative MATE family efflux protein
MTKGSILPQVLLFALPLLGSSLVQQLYNTADLLFVSNFAGKTAAAAVGSSGLIFTCLIGLFTGISVGVGIVIAHAWGAGKYKDAEETAHTAIVIGIIGSILLTIIGIAAARQILIWLNTPKEILSEAVRYVRIYFLSMISMVLYNMGASILRATGNSKIPFYILIGGGIANVIADTLLVAVFRMGVVGAAAATSISQTVSALCMLIFLLSSRSTLRLTWGKMRIYRHWLKHILFYGLPAGVQAIVLTFSNVIVQYYINGYGENAVAAYAAYFKIENIIYYPVMACGQAIMIFVGQNYGAGELKRIKKGTWQVMGCSVILTMGIAVFMLCLSGFFMSLFLRDGTVISYGISIMRITFPFYGLYAVLEVAGGALRGMGYARMSMLVVLTNLCVLRIFLLFIINRFVGSFSSVAVVYPITWGVTAVCFLIAFSTVMKKKMTETSRLK